MAVRGLGVPGRLVLTAGRRGDRPQADGLIDGMPAEVAIADAARDADALRQAIIAKGALPVIPSNPTRTRKHPVGKHLYARRHLIACCFSRTAHSR